MVKRNALLDIRGPTRVDYQETAEIYLTVTDRRGRSFDVQGDG